MRINSLIARVGLAVSATLLFASVAQASEVFTLDCIITASRGVPTCSPTTPVGTITLSNSTVDPNRIDIGITLNQANLPGSVTGLANLFLNFDGTVPSADSFHVVEQSDPAGTFGNDAGSATYNSNAQGPSNTDLDITLNPSGVPGYTYSASLLLRLTDKPKTETNLDVSMFDLTDPELDLYAAITTMGTKSPNYGADRAMFVPEPPAVAVLAMTLLGLGGLSRFRKARAKRQ